MNLIQSLQNPSAYPHSVSAIELIETHISWVLLTGQFVYKIKKPVQFDFLDFSTLEKRRFYCEEELRLNRRFAPELYLQVVPITGTLGNAKINGDGEVMEYAVKMRQFSADQLLSEMANQGRLDVEIIDQLADLIADFHYHANVDISDSYYGTVIETHRWFSGNFVHIRPYIQDDKFLQQLTQLENWGEQELLKNTPLMQQRKQQGFIRECHGDLHLGNITLFENRVTPFDGIDFNPALRWIDVMSDIAFIVMDLQYRNLGSFSYRFLIRYLSRNGDYSGLSLLRYYLVYRALVRTKVCVLRWQQHQNPQDLQDAKIYANLAENFTTPEPPALLITHGYSGSGKSTYSTKLAENDGIIHLRSDVERQRLFAESKSAVNLYSTEHTRQTYQKLADFAETILAAGFSVVCDATFLKIEQRDLFQKLANKMQVKFLILDFQVAEEELNRRIFQRQQLGNDVSEATLDVLQQQLKNAQPLTSDELNKVIRVHSTEV
ncbi:MAG: AAA family ATPase [Methylococcales bacterium]|nr:AAA family ATPase [Methylococcales bacterium]